ncbi:MAG: transketolase [Mycoplasma sp.]|nr:transketolase [Mycoplasma sp.]
MAKEVNEKNTKILKTSRYAQLTIDTIRILGCEMITEANSGHPGIVLGAAPLFYVLFKNHLVANPKNKFMNRDRLVLSAGHGSALLYSLMHLSGYPISINDLKNFRKINSITAGHPENTLIEGIDATTGPLGQGVAVAVGMAIGETKLRTYFKKYNLFNHYTYCVFGDGCFQEGVSYEAFSLAAKYKLNKLIFIYDSNGIQLDGTTKDSTITDTKKYFESLGLNYIKVNDGNDTEEISEAISKAKLSEEKPTVIEVKTVIGYGSVHENSNKAHGAALSQEQLDLLKNKLEYHNEKFEISKNAYSDFDNFISRGEKASKLFDERVLKLKEDKIKFEEFKKLENKEFSIDKKWFNAHDKDFDATRVISYDILQEVAAKNPLLSLISADIASSTKILYKANSTYSDENRLGININVGVREFAMTCINSGLVSHGLRGFASTFLSFADYCKGAIRLAAISKNPIISVFSHDSIAVGEDGPTHQPIEQIWSLRLIPNHVVFKPCNKAEMIGAMTFAAKSESTPVTIITSRQEFKQHKASERVSKGGYVILNNKGNNISLIACGSEVALAFEVCEILEKKYSIKSNIISMPSFELFLKQTKVYRDFVLGNKPCVAIEYGSSYPWYRIASYVVGINKFGYSGKYSDVVKKLKITPEEIAEKINTYYQTVK